MPRTAPSGFACDGRRYIVGDPDWIARADAYVHNDTLYIQADHRGNTSAHFNQPQFTKYAEPLRCIFLRDDATGAAWSAPLDPIAARPDAFEFSAGLDDLTWTNLTHGIEAVLRLFVPRGDSVELWSATVTNRSRRARRLSMFSYFPVGSPSSLYQRSRFDARSNALMLWHFPSHSDADEYHQLVKRHPLTVCLADRRPVAWEASRDAFAGPGGLTRPAGLARPRLACRPSVVDAFAAIMQFPLTLKPGQSATVRFVFGPARDLAQVRRLGRTYLAAGGFGRAWRAVQQFRDGHQPAVRVATPDADFDHYLNHWLPKQVVYCGEAQRMSLVPCVRNCLQDIMSLALVNPSRARELFLKTYAEQDSDGGLWKAVMLAPLPLDRGFAAKHRDKNVWGPLALQYYLAETGDFALLNERVGFKDKPARTATIYRHVCLGMDWLLGDRTARGLNRLGEGDWCDPLNMAGIRMKGESVWLSQATIGALDAWADVAERIVGDTRTAARCRRQADALRKAVNRHAWDGGWYVAGFTDAGRAFGAADDAEGKVWLNAQSWALIGGVAKGRRADQVRAAVRRHLSTPWGPTVLGPAYTSMREDLGRVTIKAPGTNENGGMYCHAAAFWAWAMYRSGRPDDAFDTLRAMLPGWKRGRAGLSIRQAGQLPLYIPNMLRGPDAGWTAGQSSHYPGTGTASWFYRLAVGQLLGVRAEPDGLRIDPQLPSHWRVARVWRTFRGAEYAIVIRRRRGARLTVRLDGTELRGNLVPLQPAGSRHEVAVTIPL